MQPNRILSAVAGATLAFGAAAVSAQTIDSASIAGMKWRELGPAELRRPRVRHRRNSRARRKRFSLPRAGGGIWKTMNNGMTWRPVFDDKRVVSMGMLAIAPSDTNAGLGRHGRTELAQHDRAGRRHLQDRGRRHRRGSSMGLEKTQHIGRIVVHPRDPNTVYVAALGARVEVEPGARPLQDDRRRKNVED